MHVFILSTCLVSKRLLNSTSNLRLNAKVSTSHSKNKIAEMLFANQSAGNSDKASNKQVTNCAKGLVDFSNFFRLKNRSYGSCVVYPNILCT